MKELNHIVEELLYYGKFHLSLSDIDSIYVKRHLAWSGMEFYILGISTWITSHFREVRPQPFT